MLRGENVSAIQVIRGIEKAYEEAEAVEFICWKDETKAFNELLKQLPDKMWIS